MNPDVSKKGMYYLKKVLIFCLTAPLLGLGVLFSLGFLITFIFNNSAITFANLIFLSILGVAPTITSIHFMKRFVFESQNTAKIPHTQNGKKSLVSKKTKDDIMHKAFYEILEESGGSLTALNLAYSCSKMGFHITGKEANDFLVQKSKEFNHSYKLGPNGEVVYHFEYISKAEVEQLKSSG
jgi:hypothetical protein